MSITSKHSRQRSRYHRDAFQFVFAALQKAQKMLGRLPVDESEEEDAHISGPELLEGIRELALDQYGLLARTVFRSWGVHSTADFGKIVFELIERGEMRKTEDDQLSDFIDIYDFDEALDREYEIDISSAFED
ncbi:MAG: hypothetical protein Tsb009_17930 [Planctomycetaceae bacterium]